PSSRKKSSLKRLRGTLSFQAIAWAASSSAAWRWPYSKNTVSTEENVRRAQCRHVVESCPPENTTRAVRFSFGFCFVDAGTCHLDDPDFQRNPNSLCN